MHSRELGLVLTQQILGVDDLHYGLWDADLELKLSNMGIAQQRYTDFLFAALPAPQPGPVKILDIGCGTGHMLAQLLTHGYQADGLVPSASLAKLVAKQQAKHKDKESRLFQCRFEDLPVEELAHTYDVALFSESFQYIQMDSVFNLLQKILKPGGKIVICDFFKSNLKDIDPGDGSFGGGHTLSDFYLKIQESTFELLRDEDITARVSPNLELCNTILQDSVKPVILTLKKYLSDNYPKIYWVIHRLLRKKIDRINFKYFDGHRNKQTFERCKKYHLIVCKLKDK